MNEERCQFGAAESFAVLDGLLFRVIVAQRALGSGFAQTPLSSLIAADVIAHKLVRKGGAIMCIHQNNPIH